VTKIFRKMPIRYQLMLWFSLVVALSATAAGWVINSLVENIVEKSIIKELSSSTAAIQTMVETALDVSVRNRLRGIAEKNVDILQGLQKDVLSGKISIDQAKLLAQKILLSQPVGETGYIFVMTGKGIISVHPNKKMKDRDMSGHWLGRAQTAEKVGYIEYDWKNPDESSARSKALYMDYFEPWDWIVSVSSYRDEFTFLFDIEDLRPGIRSFQFGETGYAFVIDSKGQFVVHPQDSDELSSPVRSVMDSNMVKTMLAMKNGKLTIDWKEPKGNRVRKKLLFFHYIPELKWIVASSAYLDEIHKPLYKLRKIIVVTIACILFLVLPIGFYLGRSITEPLTRLARDMNSASSGNLDVRAQEDAHGEVRHLARHFNSYMVRLQKVRGKLREQVGERIRAEDQLKLFAKVFENALEGISITDLEGKIIAVNKAFSDITGFSEKEVLGKNPRILKSNRHDRDFYRKMWQSIAEKGHWVGEIWNRRKSGEAFPEILSISAIHNRKGEASQYVAVFHDISEMKSQEARIKHQAYHDALTGLPNRSLAQDRLTMAIAHAKRLRGRVGVFFLDLDNFKHVNDSLGHAVGDIMLQSVGERLKYLVREQDTVARLGGDEFLLIVVDIQAEQEMIELANRVIQGFTEPVFADTHELYITPSIGIALYPEDGSDAGTLIKNADVAMYQSKDRGKNKYHMFTSELSERAAYRMKLEGEFRQALSKEEFTVYFQPKVNPAKNLVAGVEALVRWQKPDGSIVSPGNFIPLAEETGLIIPLGKYVLEESCRALKRLNNIGHPPLSVAVNLSPQQFKQADIVETVLNVLEEYRLPASFLELEITETIMMTDLKDSVKKLNTLKDKGISVAIDDFGTGYSSLYYLKTFPISTLKIDQSFIQDIADNLSDAQIVETIILMAKNLGLGVVAEGVETKEQLDILRKFNCELIQGYYYARPMPLDELIQYLKGMGKKV